MAIAHLRVHSHKSSNDDTQPKVPSGSRIGRNGMRLPLSSILVCFGSCEVNSPQWHWATSNAKRLSVHAAGTHVFITQINWRWSGHDARMRAAMSACSDMSPI